jgi:hypothetical protein
VPDSGDADGQDQSVAQVPAREVDQYTVAVNLQSLAAADLSERH